LCKIKMTGTTYDRFWVESIQKRMNTIEKLAPIAEFLEKSETQDEFIEYVTLLLMPESEREKQTAEEKEVDAADAWTDEELA
jgi:hypothetical protein